MKNQFTGEQRAFVREARHLAAEAAHSGKSPSPEFMDRCDSETGSTVFTKKRINVYCGDVLTHLPKSIVNKMLIVPHQYMTQVELARWGKNIMKLGNEKEVHVFTNDDVVFNALRVAIKELHCKEEAERVYVQFFSQDHPLGHLIGIDLDGNVRNGAPGCFDQSCELLLKLL